MVSSIFRRYQQPILVIVTIVTIIPFVWFYNRSDFTGKGGGNQIATIYGRSIPLLVAQRGARKADLCLQLAQMEIYGPREQQGLMDLYESLAVNRQEAKGNFIWNSLVLKHEAKSLGVEPTEDELFEAT